MVQWRWDFNLQNNFIAKLPRRIVKVNAIIGVTASHRSWEDILMRSLQADIRTRRSSGCWPERNCNFMPDETRDREITTLPIDHFARVLHRKGYRR